MIHVWVCIQNNYRLLSKRYLQTQVHSSIICGGQRVETSRMFIVDSGRLTEETRQTIKAEVLKYQPFAEVHFASAGGTITAHPGGKITYKIFITNNNAENINVHVEDLIPKAEEINTTMALIRGVVARFSQLGCQVGGFDAYVTSNVLNGAGMSSSAAFEVLIGTILSYLYNDGNIDW